MYLELTKLLSSSSVKSKISTQLQLECWDPPLPFPNDKSVGNGSESEFSFSLCVCTRESCVRCIVNSPEDDDRGWGERKWNGGSRVPLPRENKENKGGVDGKTPKRIAAVGWGERKKVQLYNLTNDGDGGGSKSTAYCSAFLIIQLKTSQRNSRLWSPGCGVGDIAIGRKSERSKRSRTCMLNYIREQYPAN
jgi:hypothetical protein